MPLISDGADEAEEACRLTDRVAHAMADAGLYRIQAPASVGGGDVSPMTSIGAIEAVAEADGATGWNLMIGIEATGIAGAALEAEPAAEVFADPRLIISGALNPQGRADPVQGGYRVTGQWPFASGCQNSQWFHGQCIIYDGEDRARESDGRVMLREVLVPASDFRVVETWAVAGLRGSGSHDVAVDDIFVPDRFVTAVSAHGVGTESALYRMPILTRLSYNKVAVATGIARGALDHFIQLASEKTPRAASGLLRERPAAQLAIAEAEALLRSGRALVLQTVSDVYDATLAHREVTLEQRALLQLACTHATASAVRAVEIVHSAAGSTANFVDSPLERRFRDVHVVPQQIMASPQWLEPIGRVLFGMDSGSPLL